MKTKDELLKIFSIRLRTILSKLRIDFDALQEIRLRVDCPLMVNYSNKEYFISENGSLVNNPSHAVLVTKNEIKETMEYISNYSLYAFEEEIRQGFITINGGHRIGITGKAIVYEEAIKGIKYISYINVRLAHQVKGCADIVLPYLVSKKPYGLYHTLIISPPKCGKTTLLRDIIRQISDGSSHMGGINVGVVDERSEIGACYMGVPQNDLGIRTDILDCCPKAKGMMMLIRSMSPQVIAVDEIGSQEDLEAINHVISCGCKLIATVHGSSIEDVKGKPILGELLQRKLFERYIILNNIKRIGHIEEIYDTCGNRILHQ